MNSIFNSCPQIPTYICLWIISALISFLYTKKILNITRSPNHKTYESFILHIIGGLIGIFIYYLLCKFEFKILAWVFIGIQIFGIIISLLFMNVLVNKMANNSSSPSVLGPRGLGPSNTYSPSSTPILGPGGLGPKSTYENFYNDEYDTSNSLGPGGTQDTPLGPGGMQEIEESLSPAPLGPGGMQNPTCSIPLKNNNYNYSCYPSGSACQTQNCCSPVESCINGVCSLDNNKCDGSSVNPSNPSSNTPSPSPSNPVPAPYSPSPPSPSPSPSLPVTKGWKVTQNPMMTKKCPYVGNDCTLPDDTCNSVYTFNYNGNQYQSPYKNMGCTSFGENSGNECMCAPETTCHTIDGSTISPTNNDCKMSNCNLQTINANGTNLSVPNLSDCSECNNVNNSVCLPNFGYNNNS